LLTGCGGYGPVLRANWDLTLPTGCREVYETDSGESFHGDGERYHVFSLEDAGAVEEELTAWAGEAGRDAADTEMADLAEELLTELEVAAEERPDYGKCLCWSAVGAGDSRDRILLFLDGGAGKLYVVERFI